MSEAQQFQRIRRYWKKQRNQYQRLQHQSWLLSQNKEATVYIDGQKIVLSIKTPKICPHYAEQALKFRNKVTEFQLLLNEFKDEGSGLAPQ